MTSEKIVQSLRCCFGFGGCQDCAARGIEYEPLPCKMSCKESLGLFAADLIEQQDARIAGLEAKVPRWIPVTEKIPPDQEEVLVLTRSKNGVRNVDKGYWAIDHFIHRGRTVVTHWMPLPEAPKEVE